MNFCLKGHQQPAGYPRVPLTPEVGVVGVIDDTLAYLEGSLQLLFYKVFMKME